MEVPENKMSKIAVQFPEDMAPLASALRELVYAIARQHIRSKKVVSMDSVNKVIRANMRVIFGVTAVPTFVLDAERKEIGLTLGEWLQLIEKIDQSFDLATPKPVRKGNYNAIPWI